MKHKAGFLLLALIVTLCQAEGKAIFIGLQLNLFYNDHYVFTVV
jgi:hypothetical protein